MPLSEPGSLTKEPPLTRLDETIQAIQPGMPYRQLLEYARVHTHRDAPGLARKRFLLVERDGTIVYDRFLSLVNSEPITNPLVRKVMFFVWAFRDERVRRFICERVAAPTGKWRISQLVNKKNAAFFEQWLEPASARKARSNIEYFLAEETGIVNIQSRSVQLDLEDGWLFEAAAIAAQHERNPAERRRLLGDPIEYLISEKLTGLANATPQELRALGRTPVEAMEPLEDEGIPPRTDAGREWNRRQPRRTEKQATEIYGDLVKRERANKAHHLLERITADAARALEYDPRYNENIDLYFETPAGMVLAEIKSCDGKNIHSQVRKGVSQLFEYRYIYRDVLGVNPTLLLIIETKPPRDKAWLAEYLESLGIILAWKEAWQGTLASSIPPPAPLVGIIQQVQA